MMAILLILVTVMLTAFSIVREKERGTIEQLFVTPVRPLGLMLGKILPYFVTGIVELSILLLFSASHSESRSMEACWSSMH